MARPQIGVISCLAQTRAFPSSVATLGARLERVDGRGTSCVHMCTHVYAL